MILIYVCTLNLGCVAISTYDFSEDCLGDSFLKKADFPSISFLTHLLHLCK